MNCRGRHRKSWGSSHTAGWRLLASNVDLRIEESAKDDSMGDCRSTLASKTGAKEDRAGPLFTGLRLLGRVRINARPSAWGMVCERPSCPSTRCG